MNAKNDTYNFGTVKICEGNGEYLWSSVAFVEAWIKSKSRNANAGLKTTQMLHKNKACNSCAEGGVFYVGNYWVARQNPLWLCVLSKRSNSIYYFKILRFFFVSAFHHDVERESDAPILISGAFISNSVCKRDITVWFLALLQCATCCGFMKCAVKCLIKFMHKHTTN